MIERANAGRRSDPGTPEPQLGDAVSEDSNRTGTDGTIIQLPDLLEAGRELLEENGMPPLPAQPFVFDMHQG